MELLEQISIRAPQSDAPNSAKARPLAPVLMKRAVDVVASILALVVLAPLGLLLAVLIRLESKGKVFFVQTRVGRNGRPFSILKFRSMYEDADVRLGRLLLEHPELKQEYDHYHKLRDDPRTTRVGRLMRRLSLDELPQLINVLRGDMSLVGPRPYLAHELEKMGTHLGLILAVHPGLTGLWQVSGRNTLSFSERVEADVEYVNNWTARGDLVIVLRTVPAVLTAEGAL
ncbi:MAG: Undecaprenyl-phosphate galactose phosphotransferase WbaP [Rhodothermales bacterium]|jgi:Undecaprenyl-phosphate galactose phosphotransferase WbaP